MNAAALKSIKSSAQAGEINATHTIDVGELQIVFRYIEEEMETLAALAEALVERLGPIDPKQIDCDATDVYAWRVAQVIKERLESQEFMDHIRSVMTGVDFPDRFV